MVFLLHHFIGTTAVATHHVTHCYTPSRSYVCIPAPHPPPTLYIDPVTRTTGAFQSPKSSRKNRSHPSVVRSRTARFNHSRHAYIGYLAKLKYTEVGAVGGGWVPFHPGQHSKSLGERVKSNRLLHQRKKKQLNVTHRGTASTHAKKKKKPSHICCPQPLSVCT